uniref:Integron gene cassette protein n=1 Tax=Macrostomum lignano TaxID=282301 RepID=A0A1I8F5Q8_9PLAT
LLSARYNRSLAIAESLETGQILYFSCCGGWPVWCAFNHAVMPDGPAVQPHRCRLRDPRAPLLSHRTPIVKNRCSEAPPCCTPRASFGLILALNSGLPSRDAGPQRCTCLAAIAHLLMFDHRLQRQVQPDPRAAGRHRTLRPVPAAVRVLASAACKTL